MRPGGPQIRSGFFGEKCLDLSSSRTSFLWTSNRHTSADVPSLLYRFLSECLQHCSKLRLLDVKRKGGWWTVAWKGYGRIRSVCSWVTVRHLPGSTEENGAKYLDGMCTCRGTNPLPTEYKWRTTPIQRHFLFWIVLCLVSTLQRTQRADITKNRPSTL